MAPARRTRAIELVDEAAGAALGVGRSFAHPGMQHLAGIGPGGEQRVVTEHLGVAEPGTLFLLAVDRTDRRVDIDHQGSAPGPEPAAHAHSKALPMTASSWRTCPNVKARRNVPNVDGAITR